MSSVLLGLLILAAIAVALLAVPVTVAFRVDHVRETRGQVLVRWLFGLVRFRFGLPVSRKEKKPGRKPSRRIRARGRARSARGVMNVLGHSAFRRRSLRFVRDMVRAVDARDLYLRVRLGLGDPADTGRLWAILGPLAGVAGNLRLAEIRIEPEFTDPLLEVESRGALRVVPLRFIALAVAFAASPATLGAWRAWRQGTA